MPSCWAVLPQGNQVSVIVAVEDSLYVLDPFEPKLQVRRRNRSSRLPWGGGKSLTSQANTSTRYPPEVQNSYINISILVPHSLFTVPHSV